MKIVSLLILTILSNFVIAQDWTIYLNHLNSGTKVLYSDTITDKLYLGGNFEDYTQPSMHGFAEFNNGNPTPIIGIPSFQITEIAKYHDEFYLGGQVYSSDSTDFYFLLTWNGVSGSGATPVMVNGLPFNLDIGSIEDIKVINDELYIAGGFRFTDVDGNVCNGIAKLVGNEFKAIHNFPRWNYHYNNINIVDEITVYNNEIYVAGRFYDAGPVDTMDGFCKWNGNEWQKIDGISGSFFGFDDMLEYQGKLYISGTFDTPSNNLAIWNGSNWEECSDVLSSETTFPRVRTMEVYNGELYIGGYFDQVAGIYASNFAKFDGNEWCGLTSDTIVGQIHDMAVLNNELYIGGFIDEINDFAIWDNGYEGVVAKLYNNSVFSCIDVVGLEEPKEEISKIKIFPNPTLDKQELIFESHASEKIEVKLTDVSGKEVAFLFQGKTIPGQNKMVVDLSDFQKGLYFISIQLGNSVKVVKIQKV